MCGRFALTLPDDAVAQLFAAAPANALPAAPCYNICPTRPVAAVVSHAGARRLGPMRWGFLPDWYTHESDGPLLINARAETLAHKPAFAEAARDRRCLIPASGFYEWTKDADGARQPWFIRPAHGGLLAFAGMWQVWQRAGRRHVSCAIVTCAANAPMRLLHHRMPVIVAPQDWPLWLGEAGHGAARLMRPAPDALLRAHRVGTAVNSARAADTPALIDPV